MALYTHTDLLLEWRAKPYAVIVNEKNTRMEQAKSHGLDNLIDRLDLHTRQVQNMKRDGDRVNTQISKLQAKIEELEVEISRIGAQKEKLHSHSDRHDDKIKKAEDGLRKERKKLQKFEAYVSLQCEWLDLEDSSEEDEGIEQVEVAGHAGTKQPAKGKAQPPVEDDDFDGL